MHTLLALSSHQNVANVIGISVRTNVLWSFIPIRWCKVNAYGARDVVSDFASCGGVIQDSKGCWRHNFTKAVGICSIVEAKLCKVYGGYRMLGQWSRNVSSCCESTNIYSSRVVDSIPLVLSLTQSLVVKRSNITRLIASTMCHPLMVTTPNTVEATTHNLSEYSLHDAFRKEEHKIAQSNIEVASSNGNNPAYFSPSNKGGGHVLDSSNSHFCNQDPWTLHQAIYFPPIRRNKIQTKSEKLATTDHFGEKPIIK
ncbi:hypothetical protein V6N11_001555 [Hibiscus sabdariffa]|uniref:Uncharacterized protein n=1 Tax=Hibiscus sabdariffa TaxID=183260 RepID=A0ABR2S0B7_9ROSI